MTITTGAGKKFMEELPLSIHTLFEGTPNDTIKIALFGPNAILAPTIDTYTTFGEVTGGGYTAGGVAVPLTVVGASGSSRAAGPQFENPYINPTDDTDIIVAGVGVRGCMLYNETQGNRNIFTLDFGQTFNPTVKIVMQWGLLNVTSLSDTLIPIVGNQI